MRTGDLHGIFPESPDFATEYVMKTAFWVVSGNFPVPVLTEM